MWLALRTARSLTWGVGWGGGGHLQRPEGNTSRKSWLRVLCVSFILSGQDVCSQAKEKKVSVSDCGLALGSSPQGSRLTPILPFPLIDLCSYPSCRVPYLHEF